MAAYEHDIPIEQKIIVCSEIDIMSKSKRQDETSETDV
jgi:hypothetical protein